MKKCLLLGLLLITGCTTCGLTVATYGINQKLQEISITVGVRCGIIPPGNVKYTIYENKTQTIILNGTVHSQGATGTPEDYTYYNIEGFD